ncbi:TPA: hypothetical protein ROX91_001970 [Bacillus cereus]|nr:hypothetical protein [Bacillus cereus]
MGEIKWCPQCEQDLSIDKFGKNISRKDGLNSYCKSCANEVGRRLNWVRRYEVLSHYSNGVPKCDCCEENRIEFLALDHIDGGGKKHIESIGFRLERWIRKNGFPDGFRVLCHNCNFALGHYGYCPHNSESLVEKEIKYYHDNYKGHGSGGGARNKLTYEQATEIKSRLDSGEVGLHLAKEYGVHHKTIYRIKSGQYFKQFKDSK